MATTPAKIEFAKEIRKYLLSKDGKGSFDFCETILRRRTASGAEPPKNPRTNLRTFGALNHSTRFSIITRKIRDDGLNYSHLTEPVALDLLVGQADVLDYGSPMFVQILQRAFNLAVLNLKLAQERPKPVFALS
jgi:hypothetical protein